MSEKRYYWLKISDEFFRDKSIKKLRQIAGGDTYTIIYLKMLLVAIKQDNRLYFEGVEDTFAEELALDLDEKPDNVSVALNYLVKQGMVQVLSEEEFLLTRCNEVTGSETDSARRVRKFRNSQKIAAKEEAAIEDKGEKPAKETQLQLFSRLVTEYQISDYLKGKMETWLKYKTERKERYQEQGMKSLLKRIEKKSAEYGDKAVADLIDLCMSNNWKGIIWDQMEKGRGSIQNRVSEVDNW